MPSVPDPAARLRDLLPLHRLRLVASRRAAAPGSSASAPADTRAGRPRSSRPRPDCPGSAARASAPPGRSPRSTTCSIRWSVPERSSPLAAVDGFAAPLALGASPLPPAGAPVALDFWRLAPSEAHGRRALPSVRPFAARRPPLLWPRLTSRSAARGRVALSAPDTPLDNIRAMPRRPLARNAPLPLASRGTRIRRTWSTPHSFTPPPGIWPF